ncbi:beta-propeller fold lactonase family protein [Shewanella corallii]|uniref:Beta-propeller fold lactonase family protein n=1 Tax=Shewanella corallii TaxID=560080 RepID=A0ABT0N1N7_9GAMM|nr:beta-propeller fold lactonase family protein [Shewanella corallii]MCL2912347.1 beta-propeller fold lactonase family protein [Shewanella corallii]
MLIKSILSLVLAGSLLSATSYAENADGSVAIANRADGTVSIISVGDDTVRHTLTLPAGENSPEPMYVVYKENRMYVGDRANNRVLAYDSFGFNLLAEIPAGRGVFHMWAAADAQKLLVNNDIDNTVTVIDTNSLTSKATVAMPADLVAAGFKPHDIFVSADGSSWFVSLLDGAPGNDWVVKYEVGAQGAVETARVSVGGDPHLFLNNKDRALLVASQDSSTVARFESRSLRLRHTADVANAHGIFARDKQVYLTNIADGGVSGLHLLHSRSLSSRDVDDTPFAIPHNIVITNDGSKLYITHSGGGSNKVSVFTLSGRKGEPELLTDVTVGLNPFGLAFIPH